MNIPPLSDNDKRIFFDEIPCTPSPDLKCSEYTFFSNFGQEDAFFVLLAEMSTNLPRIFVGASAMLQVDSQQTPLLSVEMS